ncbi:ATP-binding protein [Actinokineospora sp. G85]|uniref:ATP-binding protein n=1 Tax=Actinokineospora sp. G85 TaxID=3406626 RepID=UPI003C74C927
MGRESALRTLDDGLAAIAAGRGRVLSATGGAGAGKTALLRVTAARAEANGFQVVSVAGSPGEARFAHSLTRRLVERLGGADWPRRVSDDVRAVFSAAHRLVVERAGTAPLLLVVDDLQWCDAESLRFLAFLAHRVDIARVGVLVGLLSGAGVADPVAAADLLGSPRMTAVVVPPLSPAAVDALIARELGAAPAPLRAEIAEWTGGNPFLLSEVLSALSAAPATPVRMVVPPSVRGWLAARAPGCLETAVAMAVLGPHTSVESIAETTGVPTLEAARAVRALAELGLVESGPLPRLRHPVVRAALLREVTADQRARLHASGARRLRLAGASDRELVSYLLACRVADHPALSRLLLDAVHRGAEVLPASDLAALLRSVLARGVAPDAMAEVLRLAGAAELDLDPAAAALHLSEAAATGARAGVEVNLAQALHAMGRDAEALRLLADESEDARVALLRATIAAADPTARVRHHGSGAVGRVVAALAGRRVEVDLAEAWHLLRPADPAGLALTWHCLARAAFDRTDPELVLAATTPWLAHDRQGPLRQLLAHSAHAGAKLAAGQVEQAAAAVDAALAHLASVRAPHPDLSVVAALPALLEVLVQRDEAERATRLLAERGLDGTLPGGWHHTALLAGRGALRHAFGDAAGGLADLLACGSRVAAWDGPGPYPVLWRAPAAAALLDLGRRGQARELAAAEVACARAHGAPVHLGAALVALGRAEDGEPGLALLMEAEEVLRAAGSPVRLAEALGWLGVALARRGQAKAARERLRHGLALAGAAGATRLVRALGERLSGAGGRVRAPAHGLSALTAGERRVARLAITGRTNQQIAEQLFVSRRAVEMHLTQVYRKLGIAGRGELLRDPRIAAR